MLYTASFYAPQDWEGQAYRVSRQHPRGRKVQWETLPFLYPARDTLQSYRNEQIDFEELTVQYIRGLEDQYQEKAEFRDWVSSVPKLGDFTLLCFERTDQPCHRLVTGQWLLAQVPSLKVGELR